MNTATTTADTKLGSLRRLLAAGDLQGAIRIAARFPQLGDERAAILDAHSAFTNPRFCRQIGKDPEAMIEGGRAALMRRYP